MFKIKGETFKRESLTVTVVKALVIKLEVYADFAEKMAAAIQTELDEFDNNNGV
jgi:hypothetical protein